jgi:hypothetical protein
MAENDRQASWQGQAFQMAIGGGAEQSSSWEEHGHCKAKSKHEEEGKG